MWKKAPQGHLEREKSRLTFEEAIAFAMAEQRKNTYAGQVITAYQPKRSRRGTNVPHFTITQYTH